MKILSAICLLLFMCLISIIDARISSSTKQLDRHITAKMKEAEIKPSGKSNDAEFLRRIHLDLTGKIPTLEEIEAFEKSGRDKRQEKINQLLENDLYYDHWGRIWVKWLIGRNGGNQQARTGLEKWVRDSLRVNKPYNQFVTELLTATGDTRDNPAGNYMQRYNLSPTNLTSHSSRLFLGLPMQCAECHDHKTEPWYQEDYYSLASFFSNVRSKAVYEKNDRGQDQLVSWVLRDENKGAIQMPGSNQKIAPRFLDGNIYRGVSQKKREALSEWITDRKNLYFSPAIVNRIWSQFMGRGFVEPLDAFGEEHPPTHPELLDWLAEDFARYGYNLQHLMKTILNSGAYQRTSAKTPKNEDDKYYYSHAYIKPLSAEQFFYSMLEATGFERLQKRRDKSQLESMKRDYLRRFIYLLDNGEMEEIEAFNGTIPQALMMINGPLVNDSGDHRQRGSFINYILKTYRTTKDRVERIYLMVLSRKPTTKEVTHFERYVKRSLYNDKKLAYEDLYWVLLNSAEFALNH
ncbi:MAG: DUF1549 and DUF1553 domain-containing protein [Candidatus Poribacteria bacterium]|nr:DUF1549 and DUF1553 domain-containing protein [Candidatus Poribacteria bacterium]